MTKIKESVQKEEMQKCFEEIKKLILSAQDKINKITDAFSVNKTLCPYCNSHYLSEINTEIDHIEYFCNQCNQDFKIYPSQE